MSFSSSAKEDLVKIRLKSNPVRLAQLAGLVHTCGALTIGRGRGASFSTESLAVGKLIVSLSAMLYSLEPRLNSASGSADARSRWSRCLATTSRSCCRR